MRKAEYDKIIHMMNRGALEGIDTGEKVIPLKDAIEIIDLVYKEETEFDKILRNQLLKNFFTNI